MIPGTNMYTRRAAHQLPIGAMVMVMAWNRAKGLAENCMLVMDNMTSCILDPCMNGITCTILIVVCMIMYVYTDIHIHSFNVCMI